MNIDKKLKVNIISLFIVILIITLFIIGFSFRRETGIVLLIIGASSVLIIAIARLFEGIKEIVESFFDK